MEKAKTYHFNIDSYGDPAAGLLPYADRISVTVMSGDPGGEEGEFAGDFRDWLCNWFDGAKITEVIED